MYKHNLTAVTKVAVLTALFAVVLTGTGAEARPRYRETQVELADRVNTHNAGAIEIAKQLKIVADSAGLDRAGLLKLVVTFVQTLAYYPEAEDSNIPKSVRGLLDWWQYPDETLYKGGGDCEDVAIVGYVMLKSLNFNALFVNFDGDKIEGGEGHMSIAVEVTKDEPYTYKVEDQYFAYVELTTPSPVGFVPELYRVPAELLQP